MIYDDDEVEDMQFIPLDKVCAEKKDKSRIDNTDIYLRDIGREELLNAEQEIYYADLAQAGDLKARDMLIKANLRLVVSISKRYLNRGFVLSDLIEEGNLGLMKAITKFDTSKGFRFSTYATWWIRQSIERSMINQGRTIRLPVHINREVMILKKNTQQNEPRDESINMHLSRVLGKSLGKISEISVIAEQTVSLDVQVGEDDSKSKTLKECLCDPQAEDPFMFSMRSDMRSKIEGCIDYLKEQEQVILRKRYGFDGDPHTLGEVGLELGLTRERIRQIQERAIVKLRRILKWNGIKDSALQN